MQPSSRLSSRRRFLRTIAAAGAGGLVACKLSGDPLDDFEGQERLASRVKAPTASITPGLHPLGIGAGRDALLHVPASYQASEPLPLVVLLHGAGGTALNWFGSYGARGDANRFLMLAPESRSATWDVVSGTFSWDVQFIDVALAWTFQHCAVDAGKIALAGFSDGASYALSLGVANGDLFDRVIAYSPGFFRGSSVHGQPEMWVSHGTNDGVLPINSTSREIVPYFRGKGYAVEFTEFDGGHEVPATISDAAMGWLGTAWRT